MMAASEVCQTLVEPEIGKSGRIRVFVRITHLNGAVYLQDIQVPKKKELSLNVGDAFWME